MFKKKETTKTWLDSMGIGNYTINRDLTVDVKGNVDLSAKDLTSIPVQFGKVSGYFTCADNQLTSLLGAPKIVGDSFYCNGNLLTSFKYFPQQVADNITCSFNLVDNLDFLPQKIRGNFDCGNNPNLFTLENAPQCYILITSYLNIQFNDYVDLKSKLFLHKATSENQKIKLLKNLYGEDSPNSFELMTYTNRILELMAPLKEKNELEKMLVAPNKIKKMKL
jgi:hypothetical protein